MMCVQDPMLPPALPGGGVAPGGYIFLDGTSVDWARSVWIRTISGKTITARCVAPIVRYDATGRSAALVTNGEAALDNNRQNVTYFWAAGKRKHSSSRPPPSALHRGQWTVLLLVQAQESAVRQPTAKDGEMGREQRCSLTRTRVSITTSLGMPM